MSSKLLVSLVGGFFALTAVIAVFVLAEALKKYLRQWRIWALEWRSRTV